MIKTIPSTAILVQEGLYLNTTPFKVGSAVYTRRELYSKEGYCFYNKTVDIYDDNGEVIPSDQVTNAQRSHMQYAILGLADNVNNYVSIPCGGDCKIV